MQQWWDRNWDKVLTAFFSVVVAGLIGFFSATIGTKNELSVLLQRVAVLEERGNETKLQLNRVDDSIIAINHLNNRFDSMKDRVDLAETRVAAIKELTELQRQKTVNELEELLENYGRTP